MVGSSGQPLFADGTHRGRLRLAQDGPRLAGDWVAQEPDAQSTPVPRWT